MWQIIPWVNNTTAERYFCLIWPYSVFFSFNQSIDQSINQSINQSIRSYLELPKWQCHCEVHWRVLQYREKSPVSTIPELTARVNGPCWRVMETGHQLTRIVETELKTVWTDESSAAAGMIADSMPMSRLQAVNSKSARQQPEMLGCLRLTVLRQVQQHFFCHSRVFYLPFSFLQRQSRARKRATTISFFLFKKA